MQGKLEASTGSDDLDLRQLVLILWKGRRIIVASTALFSLLAVIAALLAEPVFRAQALIVPRQESRALGGLGAVASQVGLADLAGISLGGGGDSVVALATLQSRIVIEGFIRERNLLPKLFKGQWDAEAGKWKDSDPKKQPTVWRDYDLFTKEVFKLIEDKKTGLCTVSVEWKDPVEAQQWVAEIILRTNEYLRTKAIQEGEKNLAYLEEQSHKTGQVELQQALYGLVEAEQRKLMLAKGGEEFAIRTIDPAVVPTEPARPKRKIIVMVGFLLGAILGVIGVLVRDWWRARPAPG